MVQLSRLLPSSGPLGRPGVSSARTHIKPALRGTAPRPGRPAGHPTKASGSRPRRRELGAGPAARKRGYGIPAAATRPRGARPRASRPGRWRGLPQRYEGDRAHPRPRTRVARGARAKPRPGTAPSARAGIRSDAATLSCAPRAPAPRVRPVAPLGRPPSRSRGAQRGPGTPHACSAGRRGAGRAGPRGGPRARPRPGPGGAARKPRAGGRAVELGSAQSWAPGPMPVRPRGPAPWPPGAWPSACSRRPPAPCACSTSPSP